jgi:TRAP-type C4-dicarboxylate transport system permease small subunit
MTAVPPSLHYWGSAILLFTVLAVLFGDLLPDPGQEAAQAISTCACLIFIGVIIMWCVQ